MQRTANGQWGSVSNPGSTKAREPRVKSTAESTGGKVFGLLVGVCAGASVVMLTIKLGVVLFT